MAHPIETIGTVLAAIGALVCIFGLGFVGGMRLATEGKKAAGGTAIVTVRERDLAESFDRIATVARGYQADEAIDMLRALSRILKRASESRSAEPTHKTLGNARRMQTQTAPPAWESGEREMDGRGPAGLCEARNQELEHHQNLLRAKMVDPPKTPAVRSFEAGVALARARRSAEPPSPLPSYTSADKQLEESGDE